VFRTGPKRIVCLTEEPTEILYALGEQDRIVGISAYTVRPEGAREAHPIVSAFIDGSVDKICALEPDLVIGFSDIQADLAAKLIRAHLQVLILNQRSLEEILEVVGTVAALVGATARAEALVADYRARLETARTRTSRQTHRPRVYFEEWDSPAFSGIRWVSELIELAGGEDIFKDRSHGKGATERTVTWDEVVERDPEVMIASWCGKPLDRASVLARPGWDSVRAIRDGQLHEMDPSIILQPGPACLTDGLAALEEIIRPLGQGS
jgi:iron complex transport system substrate-binding protein